MIVLDTNVVSELLRRRPAGRVFDWIDAQGVTNLSITSVTAAEMLYGVERLDDGVRKASMEATIRSIVRTAFSGRVLPFDAVAAEHYAEVVAERERRGRPVGVADAQIAAICRCRGATLATRNVRDFEHTGVELLDPWNAG
jgi:toxin FitB